MLYRVSVQTDANFVQGSVRWPSATELTNVQSERSWIRDPHLHCPDLSLTVSRDPVPGLLDLLDLGLRLKWLSILGVRVGTPLRDLAKPFQTTTEARAHCCFGCFRRLLWPIGDRGVCWTSVDRNGWHTSTWRLLTYRMPFVTSYHKNDQTCINHYTFTVHSQNRAKQCETNNMWDSSFKTQKTCTTWKDRPEFEFSCHKLIL